MTVSYAQMNQIILYGIPSHKEIAFWSEVSGTATNIYQMYAKKGLSPLRVNFGIASRTTKAGYMQYDCNIPIFDDFPQFSLEAGEDYTNTPKLLSQVTSLPPSIQDTLRSVTLPSEVDIDDFLILIDQVKAGDNIQPLYSWNVHTNPSYWNDLGRHFQHFYTPTNNKREKKP